MELFARFSFIRTLTVCAAAAGVVLSACSKKRESEPRSEPAASQAGARRPVERPASQAQAEAKYYYDLGPAEADVSAYPALQREHYRFFLAVCGACHTAARPLNAPYAGAATWERFVDRMHGKMAARGVRLDPADKQRIVDFLVFDSEIRKKGRQAEFEKSQKELQERFDRMRRQGGP